MLLVFLGFPPTESPAFAAAALTTAGTIAGTEGVPLTNVTVATFTGPADTYTATVDWGDGTTTPGTVAGPDSSGVYTVSGSHTYGENPTKPITVSVSGTSGGPATVEDPVDIAEAPVSLATVLPAPHYSGQIPEAGEGDPLTWTVQIKQAFGEDLSDYSAVVVWGDGSSNTLTTTPSPAGEIVDDPVLGPSITAVHIFYEEGIYGGAVTVNDEGTNVGSLLQSLGVGDKVIMSSSSPQSGVEGLPISGAVSTFDDTNVLSNIGDFTPPASLSYDPCNPPSPLPSPPPPYFGYVCIDWGDGHVTDGQPISLGGGKYSVAGTHTYSDEGTYTVKVTVHDEGRAESATHTTFTIADGLLTAGASVAVSATEGTPLASSTAVATFTDANPLATAADFSANIGWGDGVTSAGTVSGPVSGIFTVAGGHTYSDEGTFPIKATIVDDGGVSITASTSADVADGDMVTLSPVSTISAATGIALPAGTAVATFTDPLDTATASDFTASIDWGDGVISSGAVTGPAGGVFTVTGGHTYASTGSPNITVTVTDPGGNPIAPVTTATDVSQGDQLTFTNPAVSGVEGATFNGLVAHFSDVSTTATAGQFSGTVTWCDSTTSPATVTASPSGGFDVTTSHEFSEEGSCAYTVALGIGTSTFSDTGAAIVADAKLSGALATFAPTEGAPYSGVVASFTDANAAAPVSDFSGNVVINWGDGSASTAGTVSAAGGGNFTVAGTHTYAHTGPFSVTVTVHDVGGSSTLISGTVGIGDAPLVAAVGSPVIVEGAAFTGAVATFTDADPNGKASLYSATVDWGDGTTSTGSVSGTGPFTVTASHTYAEEGTYTVAVMISDIGGASTATSGTFTVQDAPLTISPSSPALTEGSGPIVSLGTFTDADPAGAVGDYSATVNWGDGTGPTPATVTTASGGRFAISAGHAYAEEGAYSVTITVNDVGGASSSVVESVTVADAPLFGAIVVPAVPAVQEGMPFVGTVATFGDSDPNSAPTDFAGNVTINWGDGTTTSGSVTPAKGGGYLIGGAHTFGEEGVYAVTVHIADQGGANIALTGNWTVADAPLTLTPPSTPIATTEGHVFSGAVATFTDADPGGSVSDYSATINWGDGHNSIGTVTAQGGGQYVVSGTNTYAEEGSPVVAVTVSDVGTTSTVTETASVVDAPLHAGTLTLKTGSPSLAETAALTFADSDPGALASDYAVTVNWGDGTTSAGTVAVGSGGGFSALGSHTYKSKGSYTVQVTVTDAGGAATGLSGSVTKK